MTTAARAQLTVLLALFVLLKAVAYLLDRYGLLYSNRGEVFTGAGYTDVNALLPAKEILRVRRGGRARSRSSPTPWSATSSAGDARWSCCSVSAGHRRHYPARAAVRGQAERRTKGGAVHRADHRGHAGGVRARRRRRATSTTPSSRRATRSTPPAVAAELRNDTSDLPNVRLLDPNVVSETFTALQQVRASTTSPRSSTSTGTRSTADETSRTTWSASARSTTPS